MLELFVEKAFEVVIGVVIEATLRALLQSTVENAVATLVQADFDPMQAAATATTPRPTHPTA